jgi:rfaE bifunctional protein kinase chain/domain
MVNYEKLILNKSNKILVIGDLMLDNYVFGVCNRISPEAPVPVFELLNEEYMLGGAGNVVNNLLAFESQCDLISVVGDDPEGRVLLELLKSKKNLSVEGIFTDKARKTTLKKRYIASGQQLIRIDSESKKDISKNLENSIFSYFKKRISEYKIVLISDYNKGVITRGLCAKIIEFCRTNGIYVMVDPKDKDFNKYINANLIKPNLQEFAIALGLTEINPEQIFEFSNNFKSKYKFDDLVVTLAENGIYYSGKDCCIIPTTSKNVFDVSGAGDTVFASLAICLNNNISLADSCKFANAAASIVIQKIGTETTIISDVIINLKNHEYSN